MNGRSIFRVVVGLAIVGLLIGGGITLYNAGVTAGISEAARVATASGDPLPGGYPYPGPYIGHGWGYGGGGGFGLFGIVFWILGFFLIFGLIRAAFGGGRWGGPRGGGRFEDWHRRAHEAQNERPAA